jgi:hypothetical protein
MLPTTLTILTTLNAGFSAMTRIALIHALSHSVAPINAEFENLWPQARRMNLLDDSLSADVAGTGLDAGMHQRFLDLSAYAVSTGANAILFTCSAFGSCIEGVARRYPNMPVLKPNEAMIGEAALLGGKIGLLATFGPTLTSMPAEFPAGVQLDVELAQGALAALDGGDADRHDDLACEAAGRLVARGCTLIALAQFSLARAARVIERRYRLPVLTTPASAVRALRARLE